MLPSGFVAAALLLTLIPGWWFLRRTESIRQPRQLSSLQEVLELVGVGVLTTGLAVCLGLLIRPQLVIGRSFPPTTATGVRQDIGIALGALALATFFAEMAAHFLQGKSPAKKSSMDIGPWWSVLRRDKIPEGHLSYVALSVAGGATIEGVLHGYTWSPDAGHRDIALRKPITVTRPSATGSKQRPVVTKAPYDFIIVPDTEIQHVAVKYVPDGRD